MEEFFYSLGLELLSFTARGLYVLYTLFLFVVGTYALPNALWRLPELLFKRLEAFPTYLKWLAQILVFCYLCLLVVSPILGIFIAAAASWSFPEFLPTVVY